MDTLTASNPNSHIKIRGQLQLSDPEAQIPIHGQVTSEIHGIGPLLLTLLDARHTQPKLIPGIPFLLLLEGLGQDIVLPKGDAHLYGYTFQFQPEGIIQINETPLQIKEMKQLLQKANRKRQFQ